MTYKGIHQILSELPGEHPKFTDEREKMKHHLDGVFKTAIDKMHSEFDELNRKASPKI